MPRLNARLTFAALALLLMAGPAMAQEQILEDRPVTMETLLDRIQIRPFREVLEVGIGPRIRSVNA